MNEALQRAQNFNAIEDLIAVNSAQKNKGDVFEKHKAEFREVFSQMEPLEKQRLEANASIQTNIGPFSHIVA